MLDPSAIIAGLLAVSFGTAGFATHRINLTKSRASDDIRAAEVQIRNLKKEISLLETSLSYDRHIARPSRREYVHQPFDSGLKPAPQVSVRFSNDALGPQHIVELSTIRDCINEISKSSGRTSGTDRRLVEASNDLSKLVQAYRAASAGVQDRLAPTVASAVKYIANDVIKIRDDVRENEYRNSAPDIMAIVDKRTPRPVDPNLNLDVNPNGDVLKSVGSAQMKMYASRSKSDDIDDALERVYRVYGLKPTWRD